MLDDASAEMKSLFKVDLRAANKTFRHQSVFFEPTNIYTNAEV